MHYCVPVTVFPPPTLREQEGKSKRIGGGRPGQTRLHIVFCIASPFAVSVGSDGALVGFSYVVPFPAPPERNLSHKTCVHTCLCGHV